MREISLAVEGGYHYYYMGTIKVIFEKLEVQLTAGPGYYIHSCVKMRYKSDFRPTYVLGTIPYTKVSQQLIILR